MENNKTASSKKMLMLIAVGVVIVLVIIAIVMQTNKKTVTPNGEQNPVTNTPTNEQGTTTENANPQTVITTSTNPILVGASTQAPGADLVTKDGKVVSAEGKAVKTDVAYNSPEAPKQTMPVSIKDIPSAIKLTIKDGAFSPNEFKVKKGTAVTLSLTGGDDKSHILAFSDKAMSAVYINIRPGETRATTFPAPATAGQYKFFCDFPGHGSETGTMIVE